MADTESPFGTWNDPHRRTGNAPSVEELIAVFDEAERTQNLSDQARSALVRVYDARTEDPVGFATWVRRPAAEEFDPVDLEGELEDARIDALLAGAPPTVDEIARWQERRMARDAESGEGGFFAVSVWRVADGRGRERLLATLHVDDGALQHVVGLFASRQEIVATLAAAGEFVWMW